MDRAGHLAEVERKKSSRCVSVSSQNVDASVKTH